MSNNQILSGSGSGSKIDDLEKKLSVLDRDLSPIESVKQAFKNATLSPQSDRDVIIRRLSFLLNEMRVKGSSHHNFLAARVLRELEIMRTTRASRELRSLEFDLGNVSPNQLDPANYGLFASTIVVAVAVILVGSFYDRILSACIFGGFIGSLFYTATVTFYDKKHISGPEDFLRVLWRSIATSMLGVVIYGLWRDTLIPSSDQLTGWGLFSISAISGILGRICVSLSSTFTKH